MAAGEAPAVWVKGAYKYYGREKDPNKKIVLNYLNMSVQKGSIYGLLGASGCGKTTLLSCVVGRKSLHAGQVRVLGSEPGHATACRIGYMPQDVALVGEFSVRDAVYFFGRIHGLSESQISSRMAFLMDLLELPCEDRLVKNLSGGQQRRVSFAAALVHEPELLILDEPTVGLDPVLRDRIWNYMVDLADNKNVAVVITTHYIEETKQAHTIGLMRGGELLAEESPSSLMRRLNTSTLEDAFLALSIKQSRAEGSREEPVIIDTGGPSRHDDVITEKGNITNHYDSKDDFSKMYCGSQDVLTQEQDKKAKTKDLGGSSYRYKALFLKNMQQFARQPEGLIFSIFFPIIQMMAFLIAVGHEPRELHLGIVNHEVPNWSDCLKDNSSFPSAVFDPEEYSCKFNKLSCRYIKSLDDDIIKKKFFVDKESAFRAVEAGEVMGTLVIPGNFSSSTADRLELGRDTDLGTVESSIAKYWMDMSNHQIAHFFQKKLYDDFSEFSRSLMADCQLPTNLATMPMRFHDPIYGKNDSSFTAFMIPGIMVTILFFLPTLVTSTLMISDRLEGFWDRSIVAGVRSTEILSVHICIHTVVALFQTFELMALSFLVYSFPVAGDMVTVALLMFLQGVCGMCFGFLISVLCNSYVTSSYITTGSFYPMILLCGILWPIEGMNSYIRVLSYLMPFTVPIRSLRNVMEKGWDIANVEVYNGFLVTFAWIIALIILCYAVLRIKKS